MRLSFLYRKKQAKTAVFPKQMRNFTEKKHIYTYYL